MLPLAHLGHVLIDLPIFLGPVLFLLLALGWHSWRARRNDLPER